MAMRTERSKALHNFTMPPDLRWGNRRFLRCIRVNSNGEISPLRRFTADNSCSSDQRHRNNSVQQPRTGRGRERGSSAEILNGSLKVGPTPAASDGHPRFSGGGDDDDGIAAMRQKVMFDLRTAADEMKDAFFKDGFEEGKVSGSPPAAAEGEVHRPWNLRTRRAACKTPSSKFLSSTNIGTTATSSTNDGAGDGMTLTVDVPKSNSLNSQKKTALAAATDKSPRPTIGGSGATTTGEKRDRPKFSVTLSKSDIEEDYLEMIGRRPPRRPKKRTRTIQRQLDSLFPGLWLTEVIPDMYKVSEAVS